MMASIFDWLNLSPHSLTHSDEALCFYPQGFIERGIEQGSLSHQAHRLFEALHRLSKQPIGVFDCVR
jgi:hypothetical protein